MPEKWIIKSIKCVCGGSPAQYEGILQDGQFIVFNYQSVLSIGVGKSIDEAWTNTDNFELDIFSESFLEIIDHDFVTLEDMPLEVLQWITNFIIDWTQLEKESKNA